MTDRLTEALIIGQSLNTVIYMTIQIVSIVARSIYFR